MRKLALLFSFALFLLPQAVDAQRNAEDKALAWARALRTGSSSEDAAEDLKAHAHKLNQSIIAGDARAQAVHHKALSLIYFSSLVDYAKALDHLISARTLEDSLRLAKDEAATMLGIALVFKNAGNRFKTAEYLKQCVAISDEAGFQKMEIIALNELGITQVATGNTEEALANLNEALQRSADLNDESLEAETLFNLGHLYQHLGDYPTSLERHKTALKLWRKLGLKEQEGQSLNDIGELYSRMNNPQRALANHVAAIEVRRKISHQPGLAESYNNAGSLYLKAQNLDRALANLNLALEAGREQEEIAKSYELLSECYEAMGDFAAALENKNRFLAMQEFILNNSDEQVMLERQSRYEIEKREADIDRLEYNRKLKESELITEKQIRNFLFVFSGTTVIFLILLTYFYSEKQSNNRKLQAAQVELKAKNDELNELNNTKDKFFSIISHDLKGPLNSLTSFSSLLINHADALTVDEIRLLASDLDKSVKNLFSLLDNLLEWSRSQAGIIEFTPQNFDLITLVNENANLLAQQASVKNIRIVNEITSEFFVRAHKASLNTVIRNLISNAIKFTPTGGTISMRAYRFKGMTRLSIEDNGVGMSEDVIDKLFRIDVKHTTNGTAQEKGTGLGLILCKEFMEKNKGQIAVKSVPGKGTIFTLTIPSGKTVAVPVEA